MLICHNCGHTMGPITMGPSQVIPEEVRKVWDDLPALIVKAGEDLQKELESEATKRAVENNSNGNP